MGRPPGWVTERTGRAPTPVARPTGCQWEAEQAFWVCIAAGASSEDAALASGVSQPVGTRWFREAGGMAPISLGPCSGRFLSFAEREELALLNAKGSAVREIARRMERSPSTVSRELRAMLRREAVYCTIGPRSRSGRRIGWPHDPRPPRLRRTRDCALTYKTDSLAMSLIHEASRSRYRRYHGSGDATAVALTVGGASAGVRSRSVADCRSTSRMMSPCGSLTRPSTKRYMFKVEVRCDANCLPACARVGRCGFHMQGRGSVVSR